MSSITHSRNKIAKNDFPDQLPPFLWDAITLKAVMVGVWIIKDSYHVTLAFQESISLPG